VSGERRTPTPGPSRRSRSTLPTRKGTTKNRLHLDVRLEAAEDPDNVGESIAERGGSRLHPGWGELPWRSDTDPSGNEFCVLPARP
jgi:hypothetical protein